MKSREKILVSLRAAQSLKIDLPEMNYNRENHFLIEQFTQMATLAGIEVIDVAKTNVSEVLHSIEDNKNIQSSIKGYEEQYPILLNETDPFNKANTPDVFLCEARFGVAENAAMWLDEEVLPFRILAFLPEELIILLSKNQLVPTMDEAYERVEEKDYSYGLFIAGPSKTADIEQTLVTGAQGAKKVSVILTNE